VSDLHPGVVGAHMLGLASAAAIGSQFAGVNGHQGTMGTNWATRKIFSLITIRRRIVHGIWCLPRAPLQPQRVTNDPDSHRVIDFNFLDLVAWFSQGPAACPLGPATASFPAGSPGGASSNAECCPLHRCGSAELGG